jgi:hypothetical protein
VYRREGSKYDREGIARSGEGVEQVFEARSKLLAVRDFDRTGQDGLEYSLQGSLKVNWPLTTYSKKSWNLDR